MYSWNRYKYCNDLITHSWYSLVGSIKMVDMNIREADTLLEGASRLDRLVLSKMFDAWFPYIYRYVSFRIGNPELSGKITGMVFSDLLETLNQRAEPDHNLVGWLFAASAYRVQAYLDNLAFGLNDSKLGSGATHPNEKSGLQQLVLSEYRLQQIFLGLLPEHQHLLALRFSNKFSIEELAFILERTPSQVREYQYQALKALQHALSSRVK